jgi:hypothetical protein
MGEREKMQSRRDIRNGRAETRRRTVSLDTPKDDDTIDLKLLEAIERLERVQSKALNALGSFLQASA